MLAHRSDALRPDLITVLWWQVHAVPWEHIYVAAFLPSAEYVQGYVGLGNVTVFDTPKTFFLCAFQKSIFRVCRFSGFLPFFSMETSVRVPSMDFMGLNSMVNSNLGSARSGWGGALWGTARIFWILSRNSRLRWATKILLQIGISESYGIGFPWIKINIFVLSYTHRQEIANIPSREKVTDPITRPQIFQVLQSDWGSLSESSVMGSKPEILVMHSYDPTDRRNSRTERCERSTEFGTRSPKIGPRTLAVAKPTGRTVLFGMSFPHSTHIMYCNKSCWLSFHLCFWLPLHPSVNPKIIPSWDADPW